MRIKFLKIEHSFFIGKGVLDMAKFTDAEKKQIAEIVKRTSDKYGLPTKKKGSKKK